MTYKIKVEICDLTGTPLYWQWLGVAEPGDTVTFKVPDLLTVSSAPAPAEVQGGEQ